METVTVFWSLAIGMACGTGFYVAAIIITILGSAAMFFLDFSNYGITQQLKAVLKVMIDKTHEDQAPKIIEHFLKSQGVQGRLVTTQFNSDEQSMKLIYDLSFPKDRKLNEFQKKVSELETIQQTQLLNHESSLFL